MGLVLCGACVRHVKRHECTCPFCGAALAPASGGSRALTAAVMVGLGLAVAACGSDTQTGVGDGGVIVGTGGSGATGGGGGGTAVPLYAAVVPDSGVATGGSGGKGGTQATGKGKAGIYYGYIMVAICFCIMTLAWGAVNSFGVFFKPIINEFGWSRAATSGAFSLCMITSGLFGILAGRLSDKFGSRKVVTAGGVVLGLGYLLTSRITGLWHLYLFYGFLMALGAGTMYVPLASVIARWFIRKRGFMTGIGISGIGFGIGIMPLIASYLIETFEWRNALLAIGLGVMVLIVLLAQFLKSCPAAASPDYFKGDKNPIPVPRREYSFKEAVGVKHLWMIFIAWIFYGFFFQVGVVHIVPYATDQGMTAVVASTILTVIGIVGTFGRAGLGLVGDRLGNKTTILAAFALTAAAYLGLAFFSFPWMLYVFAIIYGSFSGVGVLLTPLIAEYYGFKALGALTGTLIFANTIGGAISPVLAGSIFDNTGSYQLAFLSCGVLGLAAILILYLVKPASR
jgi:MFS family permease